MKTTHFSHVQQQSPPFSSDETFTEAAQFQQQVTNLEQTIKTIMTPEARSRYTNIKIASPTRAVEVLMLVAQLIHAGKLTHIDDNTFKTILTQSQPQKKTTIMRK